MINILIHGLGQDNNSWSLIKKYFNDKNVNVEVPNLYNLNNREMTFLNLYKSFEAYCNSFNTKINLCGLSLGGLLALEYYKNYPHKVNSLVLIGVPHKIPKLLFTIQNIIFKFMPKSIFEKISITKKDFCLLVNSTKSIDISKYLEDIKCKTLLICGVNDKTNIKSLKFLNRKIKNSKVILIKDSGHEVNTSNPKELFNKLYEFWS